MLGKESRDHTGSIFRRHRVETYLGSGPIPPISTISKTNRQGIPAMPCLACKPTLGYDRLLVLRRPSPLWLELWLPPRERDPD